jgi:hypothetical protein
MKTSTSILLSFLATATAFSTNGSNKGKISLKTQAVQTQSFFDPLPELIVDPEKSTSLPFLPRPKMLDRTLPGDRGFDPFNIASDESSLAWYRDAELKHSRLAMLAAIGWPVAELFHKGLATEFDLPSILSIQDKVPSVLNGGLTYTNPIFWMATILVAARLEATATQGEPGDYGFDPFGIMKGTSEEQQFYLKEAEIFNGRLAQLAIVGFAIQEFITNTAVVNETPFFFKFMGVH